MLRLCVMRGLAALLAVLTLLAGSAYAADSYRTESPLAAWRFQPGHAGVDPADADWVEVTLPYLWTETRKRPAGAERTAWATQDLRDLNSGWYETDVDVPAEWQGRRIALDFSGVQCDAIVSVNGRRGAARW